MKYQDVIDYADEKEIDITMLERPNYENAIIGISHDDRVIYDLELMIQELMKEDNISYEEARDYIEYNVIRALSYYDNAPIIIYAK